MPLKKPHTFHIPVMGIGFTIDTPLKVGHYGIDSVVSTGDDALMERLREVHCRENNIEFIPISEKEEDYRARRMAAYLDNMDAIIRKKFEYLIDSALVNGDEYRKYIDMLPSDSILRNSFQQAVATFKDRKALTDWMYANLDLGRVDVNIMTKADKENFDKDGNKLPPEENNAHVALRGFAISNVDATMVFSAGMNPRLYGYLEQFADFFPDKNGFIKKRIALKVSDFRSANIQSKFLAKKGIWVSEFRIESGLNCGGHAFATDGSLLGPILAEFKNRKEEIINEMFTAFSAALKEKGRTAPAHPPVMRVTAQGGIGTAAEHSFILDYYGVDSAGWGTPFLLVPEVSNVDENTLQQLVNAKEKDLYLSPISPLGVPFNSIRNNTKGIEKQERIEKGRPGAPCNKEFLKLNREFTEDGICMASRQYQVLKLKQLDEMNLSPEKYKKEFDKVVARECICTGLVSSVLQINNLESKADGKAVSICPGPNLAYYNKILTLHQMVHHIYGRANIIERTDRPVVFVKELQLNISYIKDKLDDQKDEMTAKQQESLHSFVTNLQGGVRYYTELFTGLPNAFPQEEYIKLMEGLKECDAILEILHKEIDSVSIAV
jgi:hypothetical protein